MYIVLVIVILLLFLYHQYNRFKIAFLNIRNARRNNKKVNPEDVNVISFQIGVIIVIILAFVI